MSVKLGLWSLTLIPGEKYPLYVKHDFQITNAALSDDLASADGRSVVKVTHHPVNPAMYDSDDSEIDSDDEDLLGDDDLPEEDEFELDVEEGFKEVSKKGDKAKAAAAAAAAGKTNGDAEMDDEDEDDEDEDDEDDDDFSDVEVEVTNVICALTAGKIEQANINLTFTEGDAVMFEVTGDNAVHLMGNYIAQPNPFDSDSEDDEDDFDDYDDLYDDEDEDDEDLAATIEELPEPKKVASLAKTKPAAGATAPATTTTDKKRKADAIESPAAKSAAPTSAAAAVSTEGLSKAQKKKLAKKAKTDDAPAPAAASAAPVTKPAGGAQKRTLPSGLIIEDVKQGTGPTAKSGKRLSMRYIGKLENGKQFDANTAGKPFMFNLGRGEVIKGWDQGLVGMAVGGERRLTIPAALAYGNQKIPGIPKNSTLNFDVKLLAIN